MMKKGLILMLMLSLLGHIAAAGMLYVAGAYGVWDRHPRDGKDDQRGDAVKVLWGFAEEIPMSPGSQWGMKIKGRVIARAEGPKQSLNVAGFGIASHPADARNDNAEAFSSQPPKSITPAEVVAHPEPEGHDAGLYGQPSEPEADGLIAADGSAQQSDGDQDSSAPSTLSAGTGEECNRSVSCMEGDGVTSATHASIDNNGGGGKGDGGESLKTFLEALRAEIERHKNYPPFARKNGIEGTAYLNFHIGNDGRPGGVILKKSSGSKMLDDSAIRTLKSMERFYPVPEEIMELEITVPIAYRLVED